MTQSRTMSLIEACVNIAVGFALAMLTQLLIFPWFGLEASASEHMGIAAIFTAVSLIRSYTLRRIFNRIKSQ